ncbi:MAG: hypothetical protein ACO3AD_18930 [Burkholderiaceae bacterium]|jgi:hypothetical protein
MKREKIDEIIHALRVADCDVVEADFITLIVGRSSSWPGSGDGRTYLLQLGKSGRNADQLRFARNWRGHFAVVTTPFEALDAVGVIDER